VIEVEPHPLLRFAAFSARFPGPLSHSPSPEALLELLAPGAPAPLSSDDAVRAAVRDLLRHGGYKPTGRGKPSSEYLLREGAARPINLAVDVCNAVSLHSGLPISVVDLERATPPFRIAVAGPGESYVFNAAGQAIDLEGLLCLRDAQGPCANAVKDSQRTKTSEGTTAVLYVIWGSAALGDRAERAAAWAKSLLEGAGGCVGTV
jgi:DNA/RNA-binding domain of Phe-tRNA-synthetase-like protein